MIDILGRRRSSLSFEEPLPPRFLYAAVARISLTMFETSLMELHQSAGLTVLTAGGG